MVGFKPDVESYLIFVATIVYLTHVVVSFGYFISCAAGDVAVATVIASPIIVPLMLFSGFMLNDAYAVEAICYWSEFKSNFDRSIPVYFIWLAHLSFFKYANEILVVNQWHGVKDIGFDLTLFLLILTLNLNICFQVWISRERKRNCHFHHGITLLPRWRWRLGQSQL